MNKFPILILILVLLSSCKHDPIVTDNNQDVCDSTMVSYIEDINPILEEDCVSCHQGSSAFGNVWLDNYSDVKGIADLGSLLGRIKHDALYSAMPQGALKLDDCKIATIENWIAEGALNN